MKNILIAAVMAATFLTSCGSDSPQKPNILIVLTDDQGWGDLSVHGNENLDTPNIDALATDGAIFERFFVSPVCSPTRAEFLTGRYHVRGGVYGTSAGSERLDLDEHTIAETFQAAGYRTGAFGKWHNGGQHPYHPNSRGFEEYYGFTSGHWAEYFDTPMDHNGKIVRGKGFIIDDLTDHAIEFMKADRERPFFCYVPYNTPHSPMQAPDGFYQKFERWWPAMRNRDPGKEDVPHTRAALAMCENIDWNVGRMLAALYEMGAVEDTIVFYFSDNGPNGWRWNGDMKGRKGSTDEGGVRVPGLMRWPGKIEAGRKVTQIAAAIDLLPTFADMAGIPVLSEKPLDGVSLKPLLLGETAEWPERMIFTFWRNRVSVRTQQFRMDPQGQLFDIPNDPGQRQDVAADHPEVAARLKQALDERTREAIEELGTDDRPFPVGHAQFTLLPARDGISHGNAKRSNRFPNSSYFLNWTSTQDRITWDIGVEQAGDYEAVVYYACPAADIGATIELSFLDASISAKVSEAHDPPLIGAANDRSVRTESYTKDFKPMALGTISLARGRGQLTLRATDIPGKQVMEVHSVTLTRSK